MSKSHEKLVHTFNAQKYSLTRVFSSIFIKYPEMKDSNLYIYVRMSFCSRYIWCEIRNIEMIDSVEARTCKKRDIARAIESGMGQESLVSRGVSNVFDIVAEILISPLHRDTAISRLSKSCTYSAPFLSLRQEAHCRGYCILDVSGYIHRGYTS